MVLNGRTVWQIAAIIIAIVVLAVYFIRHAHYSYPVTIVLCILYFVLTGIGYCNTRGYVTALSYIENRYTDGTVLHISGRIYDVQEKENSIYCYVSHVKQCDKVLLVIKKENQEESGEELSVGYTISADAKCSGYSEARNDGGFDEKKYYQSLGIGLKLHVTDYRLEKCSGIESRLKKGVFRLKLRLRKRIEGLSGRKYAGLYKGILLGDRESISQDISELYRMTGISHILSISGLHISLIGYFVYRLARRLRGMLFSTVVSITIMYIYTVMTGAAFSTKRAIIMFGINIAAQLIGRSYDLLSALGIAFIVLITENPLCIQNTGVQLSFGAIIGVGVVYALAEEYVKAETRLARSLMASMCIDMVTRPVMIHAYNMIPMYSAVINPLVLSVMGLVVAFGICGIMVSYLWFGAGRLVFSCGCMILRFYEGLCRVFIRLPYAVKIAADVKAVKIILYYAIIAMVMVVIQKTALFTKKNHTKGKPVRFMEFIVLCIGMFWFITYHREEGLTIKMLDVGQGDCIFVCSDGMTMLVDAGSSSQKDIMKYTIYPFLKANGVERLDYLLITHSDYDHISGATELMQTRINGKNYVKNLVLQDIDESVKDEAYRELVNEALSSGIRIIYLSRGQVISWGKTDIVCLWPVKGAKGMDKNTLSIVFELRRSNTDNHINAKRHLIEKYGTDNVGDMEDAGGSQDISFNMIFTGDLSKQGEQCLTDMGLEPADVLKTGHHGSNGSSCEEFLAAISPKASIISCGINNRYGHPGMETLARLEAVRSAIYTTQASGQISIFCRKNSFYIETFTNKEVQRN